MTSRPLPNLAISGFWDLGEDAWKDENDLNLLKLSVLVQGGVISKVSSTPGSPSAGDVHIFDETHGLQPNKIAVFDDSAWVYFTPNEGWLLYNRAEDYYEKFDGSVWAEFTTVGSGGGGATVSSEASTSRTAAATDSGLYIRFTSASAKTMTFAPESGVPIAVNTEITIRNSGSGNLTLVAGSGVTLNPPSGGTLIMDQRMTATIKKVASDVWDVIGHTVAA